ncbi:hypothetical protein EVAR_92853_1 [Eumeta japonica]|uniref:Uncharacterized protein n=1 Tax=Eumeta variegata TaxID=151549 RepID=A0A4C1TA50_EUMVA|nr:hypothetical protein EVAR_92853_1 [Eumeta japonica]
MQEPDHPHYTIRSRMVCRESKLSCRLRTSSPRGPCMGDVILSSARAQPRAQLVDYALDGRHGASDEAGDTSNGRPWRAPRDLGTRQRTVMARRPRTPTANTHW